MHKPCACFRSILTVRFAHSAQQLLILAAETVQAPVGAELIQHLFARHPSVAGPHRPGSTPVISHVALYPGKSEGHEGRGGERACWNSRSMTS